MYKVVLSLMLYGSVVFAETVSESPRDIPVLRDVDVLVIGGTFGGVSAAVAAKEAGSSVFLVAPRPYLGEEMTSSLRLWAYFGEGSLEKKIFDIFPPLATTAFTYSPNISPDNGHKDPNLTVLRDGLWRDASSHSVQYNGDVELTVTLAEGSGALQQILLYTFFRSGENGFETTAMDVSASADGVTYVPVSGSFSRSLGDNITVTGTGDPLYNLVFVPDSPVDARYFKLTCKKSEMCYRQLLTELFMSTENAALVATKPLTIKKALDRELLSADVPFLTGSMVTDILRDGDNNIAGVVVANRSGRQAIRAKTVIDATEWASAARCAGIPFRTVSPETACSFSRVVICRTNDLPQNISSLYRVETLTSPQSPVSLSPASLVYSSTTTFPVKAYRLTRSFPFTGVSFSALNAIERTFCDETWSPSTVDASEKLFFTPPEQIVSSTAQTGAWPGAASVSISSFKPSSIPYFYVMGPCADVTRTCAELIQRPGTAYLLGQRIGVAAAAEAGERVLSGLVTCGTSVEQGSASVRERLSSTLRNYRTGDAVVSSKGTALPVLTNVEVVVVGGGTAGAPAAIAAGRQGKQTLVLEYLHQLGGTATAGRIGPYYNGNLGGFTAEIDQGVRSKGEVFYSAKSEWYRTACGEAGVTVWFGAFVEGVVTEGRDSAGRDRVTGIVVSLPDGTRGVVKADVVIDCTGNADITAAAGGATMYLNSREVAVQGANAAIYSLGNSYRNFDLGFLNETDASDLAFFALRARLGADISNYDLSQLGGSRERRRIVGDYVVNELDVLCGKTYSDTIMHGKSNFDMHSYTSSDVFMFYNHTEEMTFEADLPYRALLPVSLSGVLTTGLGISATRDAMPILRMQADVQNQGYAAGVAAAMAVTAGDVRSIDVKTLQQTLVNAGILRERVLTDTDSTVSDADVAAAVDGLTTQYIGLEKILARPEVAHPLLRVAYQSETAGTKRRLALACTLALLGDSLGMDTILEKLDSKTWDVGVNFKGMGQYGRSTTDVDILIYALSKCGNPRVIPLIAERIEQLVVAENMALSHFRVTGFATEALRSPLLLHSLQYVMTNAQLIRGWTMTNSWKEISGYTYWDSTVGDLERTRVLRELTTARVIYRLGDTPDGLAENTLRAYALDPRSVYAEYAQLVLNEGPFPVRPEMQNGTWTGQNASASWNDAAQWQDSLLPTGISAVVTFANEAESAHQQVSLAGSEVILGHLTAQGDTSRTFSDGVFFFSDVLSRLDIGVDCSLLFDADVHAFRLAKSGEGTAVIRSTFEVERDFEISDGNVAFASGAPVYQPYTATVEPISMGSTAVGYGYDFTVVNGPLWVTHLGCYDATGEGFTETIQVCLASIPSNSILQGVRFSSNLSGFLRNGYRFLRLARPYKLENGMYSIQAYGFRNRQGCKLFGNSLVATPDSADGRLTFGNVLRTGMGAGFMTKIVDGAAGYSATAASLLLTTVDPTQRVDGVLENNASVSLASPMLTVGGLSGTGSVAVARTDSPVLLEMQVEEDARFSGSISESGPNGKIGLIKSGNGMQTLGGANTFSDGIFFQQGVLAVENIDAIGSGTPLIFGNLTVDKQVYSGWMMPLADPFVMTNPITVTRMVAYNHVGSGIKAVPGHGITIHDTAFRLNNTTENAGVNSSFTLSAEDVVSGQTEIEVKDVMVEYMDFVARLDGVDGGEGRNRVVYNRLTVPGKLRKLVCLNTVTNTVGGTLVLSGGENVVAADYLDISGYNCVLLLTNNATVLISSQFRFSANIFLGEANGVLRMEKGTRLIAQQIPGSTYNTTNSCFVFNGATLQLYASDNGTFLPYLEGCPAYQILEGGLTIDLLSYTLGTFRSARICHPLTSPVPGVPGPLVVENAAHCKLSAPLSYNGPTIVKNGQLWFDFSYPSADTLSEMLTPGTDLYLAGGGFMLNAVEEGQHQSFRGIYHTTNTMAEISVAGPGEVLTSALDAGKLSKTGTGQLTVNLIAGQTNSYLRGEISVEEGTFVVNSLPSTQDVYQVEEGSFEPSAPLSDTAGTERTKLDRRASSSATWFADNFTSWIFAKTDDVGIAQNGSWFVQNVADGKHCAFIRKTGQEATISRTIHVDSAADYRVLFDFEGRKVDGTSYIGSLQLLCDGVVKVETGQTTESGVWKTITAELGRLEKGDHTLTFRPGTGNVDALIDNVRMGFTFPGGDVSEKIDPELVLDLKTGAKLDLNFTGSLKLTQFSLNGIKQFGTFSAETMPSMISGTGAFFCNAKGMIILLR